MVGRSTIRVPGLWEVSLKKDKSMAFMQTMFEAYAKAQKASKSKKRKKCNHDSSDSSNSE
jgi:hypothetical protein